MVLECGRPSFSLASEEEEKYKYPCRDAARERARQRQSVVVAGAVGGIEFSMSPRYVFSSGKGSDNDVRRDGDSSPSTVHKNSFVKAVKFVLERCGQLPRIVIHRSGFNDEKLAKRPLRPPSPKLSGTRTSPGFMAPNFNVIETSFW
ncbi:unnamed protein product [Caenorhabditis auriculariae]|uniref:Uncharacterized protein n=1 Tax=Caenorhabditis auriculariae TaxID=2777116 RepID=A0A8S1I026_9PELO|nr:unnamed protein product [Caenorhabditis auriculariae]